MRRIGTFLLAGAWLTLPACSETKTEMNSRSQLNAESGTSDDRFQVKANFEFLALTGGLGLTSEVPKDYSFKLVCGNQELVYETKETSINFFYDRVNKPVCRFVLTSVTRQNDLKYVPDANLGFDANFAAGTSRTFRAGSDNILVTVTEQLPAEIVNNTVSATYVYSIASQDETVMIDGFSTTSADFTVGSEPPPNFKLTAAELTAVSFTELSLKFTVSCKDGAVSSAAVLNDYMCDPNVFSDLRVFVGKIPDPLNREVLDARFEPGAFPPGEGALTLTELNAAPEPGAAFSFSRSMSQLEGNAGNFSGKYVVAFQMLNGESISYSLTDIITPNSGSSGGSSGSSGSGDGSGAIDAGTNFGEHRVFVTSSQFFGHQIGDLEGADRRCQLSADKAGLGGKWRAILSGNNPDGVDSNDLTDNENASDRLILDGTIRDLHPTTPNVIAVDGNLFGADLENPIQYDENGQLVSSGSVWTGSNLNGEVFDVGGGKACNNWKSTGGTARVGDLSQTDSNWISSLSKACSSSYHRLYCIDGPYDDPVLTGDHYVFVTADKYTPGPGELSVELDDFNGLAGADAICDKEGDRFDASKTWIALLQTSDKQILDVLLSADVAGTVVNLLGETIAGSPGADSATTVNDLLSNGIGNVISLDQNKSFVTGANEFVWTGIETGSTANATTNVDCEEWGSSDALSFGRIGDAGDNTSSWRTQNIHACSNAYRLYCISL